jgi:PIN domain nuclease of toxin-antitoxin system
LEQIVEAYRLVHAPLTKDAAHHLGRLPDIHRDPFDRMLICHALELGAYVVTPDETIARYPIPTLW